MGAATCSQQVGLDCVVNKGHQVGDSVFVGERGVAERIMVVGWSACWHQRHMRFRRRWWRWWRWTRLPRARAHRSATIVARGSVRAHRRLLLWVAGRPWFEAFVWNASVHMSDLLPLLYTLSDLLPFYTIGMKQKELRNSITPILPPP